jgi:nucleoside-diphosphate-sugar epimerase
VTVVGSLNTDISLAVPHLPGPGETVLSAASAVIGAAYFVLTKAGLALFTQDRHHLSNKAQEELGWRPKVSLEDGLRKSADWLRAT